MGRPKKEFKEQKHNVPIRLYQRDIDIIDSVPGKNRTEKFEKVIDFYRRNHLSVAK